MTPTLYYALFALVVLALVVSVFLREMAHRQRHESYHLWECAMGYSFCFLLILLAAPLFPHWDTYMYP